MIIFQNKKFAYIDYESNLAVWDKSFQDEIPVRIVKDSIKEEIKVEEPEAMQDDFEDIPPEFFS